MDENSQKKKISMIQIPKSVARDHNLTGLDFTLLCYFKYQIFLCDSQVIKLEIKRLKEDMGLKDNRTLKKSLNKLWGMGYLKSVPQINRKEITNIELSTEITKQKKDFVQLPTLLLTKHLPLIDYNCYKILYFLESHIIRKDSLKLYAHPKLEEIVKETGLSINTVLKCVDNLEKLNILKVERHDFVKKVAQNEEGVYKFQKIRNNYYILMQKIT